MLPIPLTMLFHSVVIANKALLATDVTLCNMSVNTRLASKEMGQPTLDGLFSRNNFHNAFVQ